MKKDKVLLISIFILIILLVILIVGIIIIKNTVKVDDAIPIEERYEGGVEYSREQLENIDIEITGLTNDVKKYIPNLEEFKLEFIEYVYLNGLVDAKNAMIEHWRGTEDKLEIELKLDDINNTELKAVINLKNSEIEILEYDT